MDFVLSSAMDLLINCLFMNATTFPQDCLLPEQLVIGQAIPQDFLKILLDKLSGDNKTFLVNQEDPEGRQQGPETQLNDEPSDDMDGKEDLLSLLQAWFLWDQTNTGQPPVQNDADEKGEGAGADPATADPSKIMKDDVKAGTEPRIHFSGRTDDYRNLIIAKDHIIAKDDTIPNDGATTKYDTTTKDGAAAKDDLPAAIPDTTEGYVQMFQPVPADTNRFLPVQDTAIVNEKEDTVHMDDIPIKPVFYKQKEDHPLKVFASAASTEDKPLSISEDGSETELSGDYRVLFQKRDVEMPNRKTPIGKVLIPDAPFLTARNAAEDDGKTPPPIVKRPAETVTPDGTPEKKVEAIPGDDRESAIPKNDSNLFQRGDHLKTEVLHGKDGTKVYDKTAFGSIIADRVERVVEQYANKSSSSDMVVRLKIDGKETILVGLKDEGQKISVQIKTGSEGVMNFIQSQKDAIIKSLEGKNIYATIMVDINDQRGFERNNRDGGKEENTRDEEQEEFGAYLNAMA